MNSARPLLSALLAAGLVILAAGPALGEEAQEAQEAQVKSNPPDMGYDDAPIVGVDRFADPTARLPLVDRRGEIDPMADRAILWPNAHTPKEGSLVYSNTMLYANEVSWSPQDDLQLSMRAHLPIDDVDLLIGSSGKRTLSESHAGTVAVMPLAYYRAGMEDFDTRNLVLGTAILSDWYLGDSVVLGAGAVGAATIYYGYDAPDYSACRSHDDFLRGDCTTTTTESQLFPAGGHYLLGNLNLTWYTSERFSLRLEGWTGVAAGTVPGADHVDVDFTYSEERQAYEEGVVAAGIPYDSGGTVGVGGAWSGGSWGMIFAAYFSTSDPDGEGVQPRELSVTPMISLTLAN